MAFRYLSATLFFVCAIAATTFSQQSFDFAAPFPTRGTVETSSEPVRDSPTTTTPSTTTNSLNFPTTNIEAAEGFFLCGYPGAGFNCDADKYYCGWPANTKRCPACCKLGYQCTNYPTHTPLAAIIIGPTGCPSKINGHAPSATPIVPPHGEGGIVDPTPTSEQSPKPSIPSVRAIKPFTSADTPTIATTFTLTGTPSVFTIQSGITLPNSSSEATSSLPALLMQINSTMAKTIIITSIDVLTSTNIINVTQAFNTTHIATTTSLKTALTTSTATITQKNQAHPAIHPGWLQPLAWMRSFASWAAKVSAYPIDKLRSATGTSPTGTTVVKHEHEHIQHEPGHHDHDH